MNAGARAAGAVLGGLIAAAESEADREVCGFVLGEGGGRPPELVAMRNAAEDPARSFRMDPRDVLAVLRRAEREGRALAAMYHSHPSGGPSLSFRDLDELTVEGRPILPGVDLWVVGMEGGRAAEVRSFRWAGGAYLEVARRRAPFTL